MDSGFLDRQVRPDVVEALGDTRVVVVLGARQVGKSTLVQRIASNERLAGLSPRAAAARGEHREKLERQLRNLEHHSACERADGQPGRDVAWLRGELSLDTELAA